MDKIIVCVIIASLSGTAVYGLWLAFRHMWNREDFLYTAYQSLHTVMLIYFCFVFFEFALFYYMSCTPGVRFWFSKVPILTPVLKMLSLVWLSGVAVRLMYYLNQYHKHYQYTKKMYRCCQERQVLANEIAKQMKIKKKVQVFEGYALYTAELGGLVYPKIYLPVAALDDVQFKNIMLHELTHYKNGDQWIRRLSVVAECLHWFNPAVKHMRHNLQHFDELYCDYCVCERLQEEQENYARTLFRMGEIYVSQKELAKEAFELSVGFNENNSHLLERVEKVMGYNKVRKQKYKLTILVVIMLFVMAAGTAYAAEDVLDYAYGTVYWINPDAYGKEEVMQEINQDFIEYVEAPETGVMGADETPQARADSTAIINTSITNQKWESGNFTASKGQQIIMLVDAKPNTVQLKVGIKEPDGTKRYVYGKGNISYTFDLNKTGTYSVFVENSTTTTVELTGMYSTKNK